MERVKVDRKQPRRVDRRRCRQQGRTAMSFVDNKIDLPAKFSKSRVLDKIQEEYTFVFRDTRISL